MLLPKKINCQFDGFGKIVVMIAIYRDCLGVDTVLFRYLSRARSRKGVVSSCVP